MSYFECFSVTVWTIFCFNPKLRLFFVRNWILLYINENANRYAKLTRSSYYRFTFLCLSFGNLVQNNRIVKVLWISSHQTLLRGKTRRSEDFFMVYEACGIPNSQEISRVSSLLQIVASSALFTRLSSAILLNETVFHSDDLILKVLKGFVS